MLLVLRPDSLAGHPLSLTLTSPLGQRSGACTLATRLDQPVDLLWVTTKATQLENALGAIADPSLPGKVIPLLNGIDHVARLRARFGSGRVLPGTIAGEFERTAPGHIVLRTPFARLVFAAAGATLLSGVSAAFTQLGCSVAFESDERTLLWRKLVLLAPMALNTTAAGKSVGELRAVPRLAERFEASAREACTVARAEGAEVEVEATLATLGGFPDSLRSSMQKDVAAGRPPELDAIAGPILRGGHVHGIPVPVTAELAAEIGARE